MAPPSITDGRQYVIFRVEERRILESDSLLQRGPSAPYLTDHPRVQDPIVHTPIRIFIYIFFCAFQARSRGEGPVYLRPDPPPCCPWWPPWCTPPGAALEPPRRRGSSCGYGIWLAGAPEDTLIRFCDIHWRMTSGSWEWPGAGMAVRVRICWWLEGQERCCR